MWCLVRSAALLSLLKRTCLRCYYGELSKVTSWNWTLQVLEQWKKHISSQLLKTDTPEKHEIQRLTGVSFHNAGRELKFTRSCTVGKVCLFNMEPRTCGMTFAAMPKETETQSRRFLFVFTSEYPNKRHLISGQESDVLSRIIICVFLSFAVLFFCFAFLSEWVWESTN